MSEILVGGFCVKHGKHFLVCHECHEDYLISENKRWIEKQAKIKEVVQGQKIAQKIYYAMTSGLIEND